MISVQTPEWVKHAVFYQIFPDRFASSKQVVKPGKLEPWEAAPTVYGFKGGDLLGIVEHLDYLQDLGITALYLNPIFQSASNHRYHTHDYFEVDPLLGGNEAFTRLLKEVHRREMRLVLDGVFNHASRGFYQFNHVLECGESSPYTDWFDIKRFPLNAYNGKPNYRCWFDLPALPEFNTNNPQVRQFIFNVARYWIDQGIDGWRLDVPFCIDDDSFWQEFRQTVKSANPNAYLVGEIPWEAQRWLQGDQFDGVMNYQFMLACLAFFGGEKVDRELAQGMMGFNEIPVYDAPAFAEQLHHLMTIYPRPAVETQLNLLSSHDMPRFSGLVHNDPKLMFLATLVQMTMPGAPCIYYGDEIGLKNGPSRIPEDSRYAFPWRQTDSWDYELQHNIRSLISIRQENIALRTGEFITLHAEDGVFAYLRRQKDNVVVVVINHNDTSYGLDIPTHDELPEGAYLSCLMCNTAARVVGGHITRLAIAPHDASIFAL